MNKFKIRTKRLEYLCDLELQLDNCWFLFDVTNERHWKVLDFVVCKKHSNKLIDWQISQLEYDLYEMLEKVKVK